MLCYFSVYELLRKREVYMRQDGIARLHPAVLPLLRSRLYLCSDVQLSVQLYTSWLPCDLHA
jgi:hypothetical protein